MEPESELARARKGGVRQSLSPRINAGEWLCAQSGYDLFIEDRSSLTTKSGQKPKYFL